MNGLDQEQDFDFGGLLKSLFTMTPIGARWAQAQSALESISMRRAYEQRLKDEERRKRAEEADIAGVEGFGPGVYTDPMKAMEQLGGYTPKTARGLQAKTGLLKTAAERRGWTAAARPEIYRTPEFTTKTEVGPAREVEFSPAPVTIPESLGAGGTGRPEMTYAPPSWAGASARRSPIETAPITTRQVQTGEREATLPEMLQRLGPDAPYALERIAQHGSFFMPGSPEARQWTAKKNAIEQAKAAANAADPTGGPVNRQVFVNKLQESGFGAELTGPEPAESRDEVIADLDAAMQALPPNIQKDPTVFGLYRQARRQTAVGAKDAPSKVTGFYTSVRQFQGHAEKLAQFREVMAARRESLNQGMQRLDVMIRSNQIQEAIGLMAAIGHEIDNIRADLNFWIKEGAGDPASKPIIDELKRDLTIRTQQQQRYRERLEQGTPVVPPPTTPQGGAVPPPARPASPTSQTPALPGTADDPRRRLEEKYGVRIR